MITLEGLRKDILRLQAWVIEHDKKTNAQIKMLQDLVVLQADKISVLEVEIGQVPLTPSPAPSKTRIDKGAKGNKNK